MEAAYREEGYLCPLNERVRTKADAIMGDAADDREKAEKLFRWVRDMYCWDMTKIVGADTLLAQEPQVAMSFSKSCLLVSLLRSQDIPARFRMLTCTMYNGHRDTMDDSIHAPAEAYLDGEWVVADPTYGEHTRSFREPASFGEETWETVEKEETKAELSRGFVWMYNYLLRFMHPEIRQIRADVRACQSL